MLIINEWRYAFRQPLLWLCIVFPVLFSFVLSIGISTVDVDVTKQFQLKLIAMQLMSFPLLIGVLSPLFFLRDHHANMEELIAVTPIKEVHRGLTRVIAAFIVVTIIAVVCIVTMMIANISLLGVQATFFITALFNIGLFVLPNIFLLIVIGYVVCQKSTNSLLCYVTFGVIWIGYVMLASITGSPILAGSSIVSMSFYNVFKWLDPFGFTAIISQFSSADWYANFMVISNRLAVLVLSAFLLFYALTMRTSMKSRTNKNASDKKADDEIVQIEPSLVDSSLTHYQTVNVKQNVINILSSLYKSSFQFLLFNRVTIAIFCLWPLLIFNEVMSSNGYAGALTRMDYTSLDVINRFAFNMLPVMGTFLIVLWSWQLCSTDRNYKVAELIAATPIKNYQMVVVQLLVITSMVGLFLLCTFLGASVGQWLSHIDYDASAYLFPFLLIALPMMLMGWLFVSIFNLCKSPITAAIIISFILLAKFSPIMTILGLTHTFFNIAWAPIQEPDLFWGYRASISSYWPYMQTWIVAISTFVVIAVIWSYRGVGLSRARVKTAHSWLLIPVGLSIVLFGQLHLQLVDERPLTNSHKREAFKAKYELGYVQWQDVAQPSIHHIDAQVDIYPQAQKAKFALTYTLVNEQSSPIKQVLVGRAGFYHWAEVKIPDATRVMFDKSLNQAVYEFDQPMQPGETRTLFTEFEFEQPELWPIRGHQYVTPELTYIRSVPLFPTVGYQKNYELRGLELRAEYSLNDNKAKVPSELFADENTRLGDYDWITMSSTVTTKQGHQVVSQGELIAQTAAHGRSVFKFDSKTPFRAIPAWFSMPFDAISTEKNGVRLQVYTPEKGATPELNLKGMADTIEWFSNHISPYRAKQLSLVNVPDISGATGYALPQIILLSDNVGFRGYPSDDAGFDQRYRRAVHETAHQWFGHDIGNGVNQDYAFLIESMAKYIELVLLEKHYGKSAVDALVEYEKTRYQQRTLTEIGNNVALIDATQAYDQYSRATLVFAKLREEVGDEVITRALKALWQAHGYTDSSVNSPINSLANSPANSMDFVRYLKAEVSADKYELIEHLFLKPDSYFLK